MKNLHWAQKKPLFVLFLLLGILLGCNKDFDLAKDNSSVHRQQLKTLPITIAEAKNWYEHRTERNYDTLSLPADVYPLWFMAQESKYKDSADILIVPISPQNTLFDIGANRGIRLIVFKKQDGTFGGCFLYFAGQNSTGNPNQFNTADFTGNMFTYSLAGTPLSLIQINAGVIVGGTNNPDSIYAKTAPPLPGSTTSGVNLNTWNTAFWDISAYFSQALDDGNHNGGTKIITVWGIGPVRITFNEPPGNSSTGGSGGGSNSLSQVFQNAIFGNESVFNHATEYPCRNEWQPQSGGAPSGNSRIMPALLTAHPKGIGNFVQQWIQLMATGNYSSPTDAMNDIDWDEVGSSDTHEMMDDSPLNTMILQSIASMLNGAKNQGCGYTVAEAWNGIANSPLGDLIELSQSLDLNVTQMTWLGNNSNVKSQFLNWLSDFDTNDNDIGLMQRIIQFKMSTDEDDPLAAQNFLTAEIETTLQQYGLTLPVNVDGWTPEFWEILWEVLKETVPELIPGLDTAIEFKNAIQSANNGDWWQSTWHFVGAALTLTPWDKIKDSYKLAKAAGRANRWFDLIKRCAGYSDEMAQGLRNILKKELQNPHIFRQAPGHLPDMQSIVTAAGGADNLLFDVYKKVHDDGLSVGMNIGDVWTNNIILHGQTLTVRYSRYISNGVTKIEISDFWKP